MRLATLDNQTRDGKLIVIASSGETFASAESVAPTLQAALDNWDEVAPELERLSAQLERGQQAQPLDPNQLLAPLPRAYEWIDGSAFINHVVLVRKARGAAPPATLWTDPLVYQGGSGVLLGARKPFVLPDPSWGLDFEGEVCVILGDVAQGTSCANAAAAVRLVMLANDWTYRHLIPDELAKGFGFFNSKPATAFSMFAVTPNELGTAWANGRLSLPLRCLLNGNVVGAAQAGEGMHFSFFDLVAHAAKTRALCAGTILGSGTVSNEDEARGVSCLVEQRTRETLRDGVIKTPYLADGDRVRIEMLDERGWNIFGSIDEEVVVRESVGA
jgi:fumarylacetoacetate (FAA) hydrolase